MKNRLKITGLFLLLYGPVMALSWMLPDVETSHFEIWHKVAVIALSIIFGLSYGLVCLVIAWWQAVGKYE